MNDRHLARARFGLRLAILARRWRRLRDGHLAAAGLTDATWLPLVHLKATGGGIPQKELAALVGVDGSSLVRVIDILARQGLIERRRDHGDGRTRLIHLTEAGEARVDAFQREFGKIEKQLLADMTDADITMMLRHFDNISRRMTGQENAPF